MAPFVSVGWLTMALVQQRPQTAFLDRGLARLWNRDAVTMLAIAVVVPNLVFVLLSPWFLLRRMISPAIYVVAVMIAAILPLPLSFLVLLIAVSLDVFFLVAYLFDMPVETTFQALAYMGDINIGSSALYVGVAGYFVLLVFALTYLARRYRVPLRRASPLLAMFVALALGYADYSINGYKPISRPVFESAMQENGLNAESVLARRHNLLVVIVEGMGAFADSGERDLLSRRLVAAADGKFDVRSGRSNYYGSTTGAEARELCGVWGTYVEFLKGQIRDCLPEKLGEGGYRTVSYHASGSALFSRHVWYPRIGFQELNFQEDILRDRPAAIKGNCGSVFVGMCDADIGDMIRQDLRSGGDRPGLYYWLTLNSHIPYQPLADKRFGCDTAAAAIGSEVPCQLAEIWSEVFDKVAAIASDPDMPPLDILVVGDHNTPLWSRDAYSHFIHDKVDWYYLEDKRPVAMEKTAAVATPLRR